MADAPPGRRRWRRAGLALLTLLVLVAGALLAAWLLRDEPRRRVERALSERLEATVRIDSLRVRGLGEVELGGVAIGPSPLVPSVAGIRVRRLAARGSLRAMAAGRFEELALSGVDLSLAEPRKRPTARSAAAGSGSAVKVGRLDVEELTVRAGDEPPLAGALSATGVGSDALSATATFEGPSLRLAALAAVAGIGLPDQVDLRALAPRVRIEHGRTESRLHVDLAGGELRRGEGRLALPALAVSVRLAREPVSPVEIALALEKGDALGPAAAELSWDREQGRPLAVAARIERIDLAAARVLVPEIDPRIALSGEAALEVAGQPGSGWTARARGTGLRAGLRGEVRCRLARPRASLALPWSWPPRLETAAVDVEARVDACDALPEPLGAAELLPGDVRARASRSGPEAAIEIEASLRPRDAGTIDLSGTLAPGGDGAFALEGRWSGLAWSRIHQLAARFDAWPAGMDVEGDPPAISGRLAGRLPGSGPLAGTFELDVRTAVDLLDPPGAAGTRIPLRLEGRAARRGAVHEFAVEANVEAFDDAVSARYEGAWLGGRSSRGRLAFELSDLFETARALGTPLAGTGTVLRGALRGELDLATEGAGRWTAEGTLEAPGFEASSADGSRVVQGLATRAHVRASREPGGPLRAEADGEVGGAVMLWNSVFADLSAVHSRLRVDGELDADAGARVQVAGEIPSGPGWSLQLAHGRDGTEWAAHLEADDLSSAWDVLLRPVVESAWPETAQGAGLAGRLEVELAGRRAPSGDGVRGVIRLAGGQVRLARPELALEGLDLELPVVLSIREGRIVAPDEPARGSFALARGEIAGIPLSPIDTSLLAGGDRVALSEPVRLSLLGGSVELSSLAAEGLLSGAPGISAGVHLADLELADLPEDLLPFPVEGRIDARFPKVRIGTDRFEAQGGGTIAIFGGTIRLGGIAGRDLFTRYPRIAFRADFEEIDLARVTRRLGFGEITGHVDGRIADCELVGGVPVRLEAELRSSDLRRDRRTVTVRAVRNLAILGSGGSASMLDRGITRFFDRYTYSRIGIAMSLADDRFLLRGLERRGRRELFLRGRLPLPIDVVNADPGRPVSFRSMLERLRSLDLEHVTTSPR